MNAPKTEHRQSLRSAYVARCLSALRALLVLCVVFIICWGLVKVCFIVMFCMLSGSDSGPVDSPAAWPRALKDIVADAARAKVDIEDVQVHCMSRTWETEYIWQMKATRGLLELLRTHWELSPASPPERGSFCGKSAYSGARTPDWWSPKKNANTQYYASKGMLAGAKGDRFRVALDEERALIFVQYDYNF
jgi:hypothetical protein